MSWHGDKNGNMPKLLNCNIHNKHNPTISYPKKPCHTTPHLEVLPTLLPAHCELRRVLAHGHARLAPALTCYENNLVVFKLFDLMI